MVDILIKASGFILVIIIGFCLKQFGLCTKEHGKFLSTVIMNITLPCALLSSINNLEITPILMLALGIGLGTNLLANLCGFLVAGKDTPLNKALMMINVAGFNIGTFALPFVQSFFPASFIAYVCLFDTGNALMCLGGTYTLASAVASTEEKMTFKSIIKKLFSSIPFCTYITLFFLSLFRIPVPQPLITMTSVAGNANAFLAMLMIGILLEVKLDLSEIQTIRKILVSRYALCTVVALIVYFILPINLEMKKMMVLCLLSPISSVAPVFSAQLGSDSPVPAACNSLSIIISIILMTTCILFFA